VVGHPLLMRDPTREVMAAPMLVRAGEGAPVNRFFHKREFPDHTFTDVVSLNADTLYSLAWLTSVSNR
jgi:hypothetical protein